MTSRQRSFFDEVKPAKGRAHWRRSNTTNDSTLANKKPANTLPPFTASSQAKSKLNSFKFAAQTIDGEDHEVNDGPHVSKTTPNVKMEVSRVHNERENISNHQNLSSERTVNVPSTPAIRVPLADLLGNGMEDGTGPAQGQGNVTPEERVYWKHTMSPLSSASKKNSEAMRKWRSNKRARSSSPTASPLQAYEKEPFEGILAKGPEAMVTSAHGDPALELWNKYATHFGKDSENKQDRTQMFSHLLASSSPRAHLSDFVSRHGSILRRSVSCGTEWPASSPKRRRLNGTELNQSIRREATIDIASNNVKPSKVALLVGKVQESLSGARTQDRRSKRAESLQLAKGEVQFATGKLNLEPNRFEPRKTLLEQTDEGVKGKPEGDRSSDFGDLDEAEVERMVSLQDGDHCSPADKNQTLHVSASNVAEATDVGKLGDISGHEHPLEYHKTSLNDVDDDFDDFMGDANETFGADIEDVLSKYDSQIALHNHASSRSPSSRGNSPGKQAHRTTVLTDLPTDGASDDEFGDCGELEFEMVASNACSERASSDKRLERDSYSYNAKAVAGIDRFIVSIVTEGEYMTPTGRSQPEKVLLVRDERDTTRKSILLRQMWLESPCTVGAVVHLIGRFDSHGQCTVDNEQNMLILHPDQLISSTVVADSFGCTRRAVLQDRVKATSEASQPQVYGHILHEIFQEALRANQWDESFISKTIDNIVLRHLEGLYEVNVSVEQATHNLKDKTSVLQEWAATFVNSRPKVHAALADRNGQQSLVSINKLLDVEEHIWAPRYGLKGNIDATVQITLNDKFNADTKTLAVPLEVKTGRNTTSVAHRAQTALYTLLLSDRYDVDVACGILYYMETSEMSRIHAIRREIIAMIIKRNELAYYIRHSSSLPEMLKKPYVCEKCYARPSCFVYHKLGENGNKETSGLGDDFDNVTRHLGPEHATFFQHWERLLTKEEGVMFRFRKELWTMLSSDREKVGRCWSNVIIDPSSAQTLESSPKSYRFEYSFIKPNASGTFSFMDSQIAVGEPIVISDERGHFALANGYVTKVRKRAITVAVDRQLHQARDRQSGFDARNNQVFAGIMDVTEKHTSSMKQSKLSRGEPTRYRIDKDEFSNGMATVRNNLVQIMTKGVAGSRKVRDLVVSGHPPKFKDLTTQALKCSLSSDLNEDQERAVSKVMAAEDYALVLGMPGTGKTTTIAHIIKTLVSQGKSVLLTSYTHTAVDNILLKLRHDKINTLRIGAQAKIHPEVAQFASLANTAKSSIEDVRRTYHDPMIVATTCLGINHPIFNERTFDYCIVDEASQITLPVCLGPIRMANTFILVGDHNQLPPLVQNEGAREGGLDISLFKLLSEKHLEAVVNLEHQYRMCEDIMTLSNTFIYNNLLKCGNEEVANRSLNVPNMRALDSLHSDQSSSVAKEGACREYTSSSSCWLRHLVDPAQKVSFVNTDPLLPSSREIEKGSRIVNPVEAALCTQVVGALLHVGVHARDIGVISVYRSQITLLKHDLRSHPEVEMHTADRFQGRDKEVIVLSMVRSNDKKAVGDLLKDWRRINVAFTRARTKLLIVGSKSTLEHDPLLKSCLGLMQERKWWFDLPPGAPDMHDLRSSNTQSSSGGTRDVLSSPVNAKRTTASPPSKTSQGKIIFTPSMSRHAGGKENTPPSSTSKVQKRGKVSEKAIMRNRPVLQDILNDLI